MLLALASQLFRVQSAGEPSEILVHETKSEPKQRHEQREESSEAWLAITDCLGVSAEAARALREEDRRISRRELDCLKNGWTGS